MVVGRKVLSCVQRASRGLTRDRRHLTRDKVSARVPRGAAAIHRPSAFRATAYEEAGCRSVVTIRPIRMTTHPIDALLCPYSARYAVASGSPKGISELLSLSEASHLRAFFLSCGGKRSVLVPSFEGTQSVPSGDTMAGSLFIRADSRLQDGQQ